MQTLKVLLGDRKTFTKISSPRSIGPSTKSRPVCAFCTQQSCHSVFTSPVDANDSEVGWDGQKWNRDFVGHGSL